MQTLTSEPPRTSAATAGALRYLLFVGGPLAVLVLILWIGPDTSNGGLAASSPSQPPPLLPFDLLRLLAQVGVIVGVARVAGWLFRKAHQPQVVGEITAGLILGPTLLGAALPGVHAQLFPAGSLEYLQALSHIGLLVFMFLIGLELDFGLLRARGTLVVLVSHASIAMPFALGAALALVIYGSAAPPGVGFGAFALFIGAALGVTAFPVLARILAEQGLIGSRIGSIALGCAAAADVTAWSVLAAIVLLVRGASGGLPLGVMLLGVLALLLLALLVLRPLLERWFEEAEPGLSNDRLAGVLVLVLALAIATEWLGVHALFGAFLAGAIMPRRRDVEAAFRARLEDVTTVLLLPLFFAYTGLRTDLGALLDSGANLLLCGLVIGCAVLGKLGGSALAARAGGLGWREAGALGILMNTRGLMELVVLEIGLEIGILSPILFAAMVLMALMTTGMTSPLLRVTGVGVRG